METVQKLTDELIAVILVSSNDWCERVELFDHVIQRMYHAKNNHAMDAAASKEVRDATNQAGSTESSKASGSYKN
jgi:hypothetical protein